METLEDTAGVRACLKNDIVTFHHYAPITQETASVVDAINRRAFTARRRLGVLVIFEPHVRAPDSDVRATMSKVAKKNESRVIAMAHVVRGDGFRAAAFRTALAGLSLVTRLQHPLKVFATVEEGVRWLAARLDMPGVTADSTATEIEAFATPEPRRER